jgi:prepilin-type processing-associated H-X9-DG protein
LPALAGAKTLAYRVQCVNNERQLLLSWTMYSNDNRENLVLNGGESGASLQPYLWVYGGNHGDPQTLTNVQYMLNPSEALFAPYLQNISAYNCPADRSFWPVNGKFVMELRSYGVNVYMGTPDQNVVSPLAIDATFQRFMKSSSLAPAAPSLRLAFIDINPASICTPAFGVDMRAETFCHYPSSFHRGGGVITFADGHAECHKWLDPRTKKALPSGAQYIPHHDSSPNNKDLKWIQDRTTIPR